MKAKYRYYRPTLNLYGYKLALDKVLREALAMGLEAWMQATTVEVPVWSGASRATFVKVGSIISHSVDLTGGSAPFSRVGTGLAMSQGSGLEATDTDRGLYTFTYGTTLPWLLVNEYYDATQWGFRLKKPGPYDFQSKGAAAFMHATKLVALPRVAPYVQRVPVK